MNGRLRLSGLLVAAVVALSLRFLPDALHPWGQAMKGEIAEISRDDVALCFAISFLGFSLVEAIRFHLRRALAWLPHAGRGARAQERVGPMQLMKQFSRFPRRLTAICVIGATAMGLMYMALAGAPVRYLMLNTGALAIGFALIGSASALARGYSPKPGTVPVALAMALLMTSLFGAQVEGATRWVAVGGLFVQSSLLFLPFIAVQFAGSRDRLTMLAVMIAALAVAGQPDRAMSGALAAAMATLVLFRPGRKVVVALAVAVGGFAVTLARPDILPAMPFVDQIYYSSFDVHPLAGMAVLGGAVLMIVPAISGAIYDREHRETYAVFGAVWLAIILAAALGNYPTPIVGYGGSAIIGYVICLLALPNSTTAGRSGVSDCTSPLPLTRRHDTLRLLAS